MLQFLTNTWGTLLIGAIVAAVIAAVVVKLVRDKRKGKVLGCDCGCGSCPKAGSCDIRQR
ncbi:MAG: FeoB-associated Cys-rich membrane protein [Oscillospiraceae bacterium]|jgi:hypothetical protein|nr:FeoB-associated Cys-rich membrane protein [Oscillospiraceae bacterium]